MLTWEEVSTLHASGIELGSHTASHPLLVYESPATVTRELAASRKAIEERTGCPVRSFAYPNGTYNEEVRAAVADSGYQYAFSTDGGWHGSGDDPLTIRRILLHEGSVVDTDGHFSPAAFELALARGG